MSVDIKLILKQSEELAAKAAMRFPGPGLRAAWIVLEDWSFLQGYHISGAQGLDELEQLCSDDEKGVLRALAFLLGATALGDARSGGVDRRRATEVFSELLKLCAGLNWELVESNRYRREELVRKWLLVIRAPIAGETEVESREKSRDLDYRMVLSKASAMDQERSAILAEWNRKIAEARAAEAARQAEEARNRGNYE